MNKEDKLDKIINMLEDHGNRLGNIETKVDQNTESINNIEKRLEKMEQTPTMKKELSK